MSTILNISIVLALLVIAIFIYHLALKKSVEYHEIIIKEIWGECHNNGVKYYFSDTNGNEYYLDNTTWICNFDVFNQYAKLELTKSYSITTIGWRIPFFSWCKNCIQITEM